MANFLKWILMANLFACPLEAKNLGVYGSTASIEEEDLIRFIQEKIQKFSEEERQAFMQGMRNYFTSQLKKTMEVKGIQKARLYSVNYFDPSICVDRDIFNHAQQIIVKKGTSFNPLSQISLNQDLLFFDATDLKQLAWAESRPSSAKWILIKGQPMQLEEDFNRPIYFDQGGVLTKKFGIQQVPACVSQEGLKLKIEFFPVQEASCSAGS